MGVVCVYSCVGSSPNLQFSFGFLGYDKKINQVSNNLDSKSHILFVITVPLDSVCG